MGGRNYIMQVIYFVLYVLVQSLLFNQFIIYDKAFCFVYISFLLMMPLEVGPMLYLLIAFVPGVSVDIFSDTHGMHAAASVLLAFVRPHWLNIITPRGGYEGINVTTLKLMGFQWFFVYALPLILIHHLVLFYVEAGSSAMFFFTLVKVLASTALTFVMVSLFQYLFYRNIRAI